MTGTVVASVFVAALVACGADRGGAAPGDTSTAEPSMPGAGGGPDTSSPPAPPASASSPDASVEAGAPPPGEDCTAYPFKAETLLAERVGFGRNATGGDPKNVYHVTTLAASGPGSLRAALESTSPYWIVFDVNGKITHFERWYPKSNKTIDGRGRDIDIEGHLELADVRNIIISDVKIENSLEGHCTQKGDVVSVNQKVAQPKGTYAMKDVWIHHVEAFNGGDGLIDLRGGTDYTVSWTHFHTHKKGLLWHNEADLMRVTAHHNFFDRVSLRGPQFIAGQIHFFNNYQYQWWEYGAGGLGGAQFFSEANVYEARPGTICIPVGASCTDPNPCGDTDYAISKEGLVHEWAGNGPGNVKSVGDVALNDATLSVNNPAAVFDATTQYPYKADVAGAALAAKIRAEAGPRKDYCKKK
ncbi:MAG: hypothetical protein JST00_13170 [Deltaproteobacteria bacterium]|nr:hypothetical protein [Deltaproteobacteria bacterium]